MAIPTEDQIRAQVGYVVLAFEELRQLAEEDGTNLLGIEDELFAALIGDFSPGVVGGWSVFRRRVSDALSRATVRSALDAHWLNYGKLIASPNQDPGLVFRDLYDYFLANSLTVDERGFSFGSPVGDGGNAGNGTLHRLNVDANGFDIDTQTADAKVVTCVTDEHSGAQEHAEQFRIVGSERRKDYLTMKGGTGEPGSIPIGLLTAKTCRDSTQFIQNPSFTRTPLTFTGGLVAVADVETSVPGWTLSTITDMKLDRNIVYRDSEGEAANATSLRFEGNATVTQALNVRNARFRPTSLGGFGQEIVPVYVQVAVYRESAADGTLTLTFGDVTAVQAIASLPDDSWSVVRIAVGVDNWFANFNKEDPVLSIALASNTTGAVLVDDVVVAPFDLFDGGWYAMVGGATPFLRGDEFTFSDTVTEVGLLQLWFVRGGYGYLPSTGGGSPSWGDPPPTPTPSPTPSPTPTPTPRTPTPTPTPT